MKQDHIGKVLDPKDQGPFTPSGYITGSQGLNQCYLFDDFPAIAYYESRVIEVGLFLP